MTISERVAYIKGLVDGLELDCNDKNSKVLKEVVLVLEDMALSIEDNEDVTNAIGEQLDEVDSDLSSLEDYVYDDEDDYEDDDVYEVECPNCHDIVYLDEEMLEDGDEEEYEESRFEAWLNKKFGAKGAWNLMIYFSVFLALVFTVGIFIILPTGVVNLMKLFTDSVFWLNFAEGVFRILLFVAYVWLISFMGEIKRVFQFHGAEHKTIHCFENGLELTPANCRQFPTLHPRCGTSFLMFVFIIAFALHFLLGWPTLWLRIVTRLLLLPVIAGLSYELLKWAGKSDNIVVKILSLPGLYLQKITTKEPDDSQLEVAIAAIHAVCDEKPCGTYTICKEDVGHYDGHELIESAKEDGDDDRTEKPQGIFVKYRPLQKRRFL